MTPFKAKTKRLNRIDNAWWINDWSSKVITPKSIKTIIHSQEQHSNIFLKSSEDSIAMNKTKSFISESLRSSKGVDGTIIIGSANSVDIQELHEILLNVQPLGWIYIPGGKKNENQ